MKLFTHVLKTWLPLAAIITLLVGLIYATVQQVYRTNANDPQIQMAEDAAALLDGGASPESVLPPNSVELSMSLSSFIIVYDAAGDTVASNATLNGSAPVIPFGSLEYAKANGQNRVTWQPSSGVRLATVIVPFSAGDGGYVLAGRSLREVEDRVGQLTTMLGLGWLVTLGTTFLLVLALQAFIKRDA
jgi:hypothetical protein